MAVQRKLSKRASLRKALVRNQVTHLLWSGRIETTLARAKEIQPMAERLITLAVRDYDDTVEVTKEFNNDRGQLVTETFTNDGPQKLASRRRIMSFCYDIPEPKNHGENKADYRERTKAVKHPLAEKMFREYGPKYRARKEETGTGGGYTRIIRKGPRRGDGAEVVIIEMI